jgi:hypothetical protein
LSGVRWQSTSAHRGTWNTQEDPGQSPDTTRTVTVQKHPDGTVVIKAFWKTVDADGSPIMFTTTSGTGHQACWRLAREVAREGADHPGQHPVIEIFNDSFESKSFGKNPGAWIPHRRVDRPRADLGGEERHRGPEAGTTTFRFESLPRIKRSR